MNSTKQKEIKQLKSIIESEDEKVWNAHKHNSADKLVQIEPTIETKDYLWERFKKTGEINDIILGKVISTHAK